MDDRHMTRGSRYREEIDLIPMDVINQPDDSVFFTINDEEWEDTPSSPLPSLEYRKYDRHRNMSSVMEDGSLGSYTNSGFQDYLRQESNIHSPFDGDTVFLFNSPRKRRFNIKKKLAAVWCTTCMFRMLQYLCCSCSCDCSCRDQSGVHCMYRLKQKAMKKLKIVQGILCLVTIIQSSMVFLPLGNITSDFDGQCLLYSNLFIHRISRNDTVALDLTRSKFGNKEDCNFTTFINVVVAITGLLFIWFFIHTSYVSGLEQIEEKLQLPFFLCYLTLLVSVIVSSFKITIGFNSWCYNIMINNPLKIERQRLQCQDYETLKWSTANRSHFYTYSVLAEVSSWLLTLTLVLQLSVNTLLLYQNLKAAYEEVEVPHLKLEESSEYSEEDQSNWQSGDGYMSLSCPPPPLQTYTIEYKTHHVLAKVVHRDKAIDPFQKFDPKETFVLDKEKFKRNMSGLAGFDSLRPKGKVDFPLKMEPGHRKRRNWTGSCEELHSRSKFEDHIRKDRIVRSHEWHGFETDVGSPGEDVGAGQICDWHADFGSEDTKIWATHSFEWPATNKNSDKHTDNQAVSHSSEWHGFENDFVGHHLKTSSSLPGDWQKFDLNFENRTTGQFEWTAQAMKTSNQTRDPWKFEELNPLSSGENNDPDRMKEENIDTISRDYESSSKMDVFNDGTGPFKSEDT